MRGFSFIMFLLLLFTAAPAYADGFMENGDADDFCVDHGDCPPYFECVQLSCVGLTAGVCRKDSDCDYETGQYCEIDNSICRYFCANDSGCEKNEYCDIDGTWHCLPLAEGDNDNFCTSDKDCNEATEYCETITHTCRPKCFSSKECPEGWVCIDYRCQPEAGDLDWDMPWMDYDEGGESMETPDWEMPEVLLENEFEPEDEYEVYEYAESGGFGESGIIHGGDKDKGGELAAQDSSCMQSSASQVWPLLTVFAVLILSRRRRV